MAVEKYLELQLCYDAICRWPFVPVLVQVRDGKANSMTPTRDRKELERIEGYEAFDTVEKAFGQLQDRYKRGDKVIVTYNEEFGYPVTIKAFPKGGGMDSEFFLEISEFQPVATP